MFLTRSAQRLFQASREYLEARYTPANCLTLCKVRFLNTVRESKGVAYGRTLTIWATSYWSKHLLFRRCFGDKVEMSARGEKADRSVVQRGSRRAAPQPVRVTTDRCRGDGRAGQCLLIIFFFRLSFVGGQCGQPCSAHHSTGHRDTIRTMEPSERVP